MQRTGSALKDDLLSGQQLPKPQVWDAFQAGMQILQRYAGHGPSDATAIAKANLRLLHRSLQVDPSYKQILKNAHRESSSNGLTTMHGVFACSNVQANLITIHKGCAIRLVARSHCLSMFMVISGKAVFLPQKEKVASTQAWWRRRHHVSKNTMIKNGDVLLLGENDVEEKILSAVERNCVLLSVSLPLEH
jgi:hypothetical protein